MARRTPVRREVQPEASRRARLLRPFGYVDGEGVHRHWHQGAEVAGAELRDLRERGAPVAEIDRSGEEG